jgi:hypothetical protein
LCGLSAGEAGQTGDSLTFFAIVCKAVPVFEVGVMDGTQNDGRVVLDAYILIHQSLAQ